MARDSIGSAVEVAARIGGPEGDALLLAARSGFIAAMHSAVLVGTGVALLGALVAVMVLPAKNRELAETTASGRAAGARPHQKAADVPHR